MASSSAVATFQDLHKARRRAHAAMFVAMVIGCVLACSGTLMSDEGSTIWVNFRNEGVSVTTKLTDPKAQDEYEKQVQKQIDVRKKDVQRNGFWTTIISIVLLFFANILLYLLEHKVSELEKNLEAQNQVLLADRAELHKQCNELIQTIESLKNSHDADIYSIVDSYLMTVGAHKLSFTDKGTDHDRISLYCFDEGGSGVFIRLGRFSYVRDYMVSGRKQYPASQGCISNAWRDGVAFHILPPQSKREHARAHQNMGLTRAEADSLTMPSRLYFGYRISDHNSTARAVIIVESTSPARFREAELAGIFAGEAKFLSFLVERLASHMPRPSEAARMGF